MGDSEVVGDYIKSFGKVKENAIKLHFQLGRTG
jgi:hypothetical protein